MNSRITQSIMCLFLGLAAACSSGGGGSDGSVSDTPSNAAPTVSAGDDQSVLEGATVQLMATASDSDGDVVTLNWTQLSGPDVTLSSETEDDPTFVAPEVDSTETVVLQVSASDGTTSTTDSVSISIADNSAQVLADLFEETSLASSPSVVSCTLSDGTSSSCLSVTLNSSPGNYAVGPWCPRNIIDTEAEGGIWLDNGTVYDVDGQFIQNLDIFYNDDNWQLYDSSTGAINYTETREECEAAARPNVDPDLQNHCVECLISFLDDGLTQTYLIPLIPASASASQDVRDGVGLAFSGIRIDGPAPVEAILGAYTLAPFDDCGGHVNPVVGYHIHAITDDCLKEVSDTATHAASIGVAMDGYRIYERLDPNGFESTDLDDCRGHTSEDEGYHYHVDTAGSNQILPCLSGVIAQ